MEDSKTTDLPIPSSNTLLEKTPLQETKYFKMRSLVSDIRPHLLEVSVTISLILVYGFLFSGCDRYEDMNFRYLFVYVCWLIRFGWDC